VVDRGSFGSPETREGKNFWKKVGSYMTKVKVQTHSFSDIRGVKECSDSLPFVLGGKHRSAGDQNVAPASRRDALLDLDTPPSTEICVQELLSLSELMNLLYL